MIYHTHGERPAATEFLPDGLQFWLFRQAPMPKEKANFLKTGFLRQFLNSISAVAQNSFVAIQKCNRAFGCSGVFVAEVQGHRSCFFQKFADIYSHFVF